MKLKCSTTADSPNSKYSLLHMEVQNNIKTKSNDKIVITEYITYCQIRIPKKRSYLQSEVSVSNIGLNKF